MENFNLMLELSKLAYEKLKSQGLSMVLLFGISAGLWSMMKDQKAELTAAIHEKESRCEEDMKELRAQNFNCTQALVDAQVRIARLEAQQGQKSR